MAKTLLSVVGGAAGGDVANVGDARFFGADRSQLTVSGQTWLKAGVLVPATAAPTYPSDRLVYGALWEAKIYSAFTTLHGMVGLATDHAGTWVIASSYHESFGYSLARSTDNCATFARITMPSDSGTCDAVATNGAGTWVAVGNADGNARILRSTNNGATWAVIGNPFSSTYCYLRGVTYSNGVWIAVGGYNNQSGRKILRSTNGGATWTNITHPDSASTEGEMYCVAGNGGTRFVIGSTSGRLYYSNDSGSTWTASVVNNDTYQWITYDAVNAVFYVSGTNYVYKTPTGAAADCTLWISGSNLAGPVAVHNGLLYVLRNNATLDRYTLGVASNVATNTPLPMLTGSSRAIAVSNAGVMLVVGSAGNVLSTGGAAGLPTLNNGLYVRVT